MKQVSILLMAASMLFASCARTITVEYQKETANTGTVVLLPTRPYEAATVTMNDNALYERCDLKVLTIKNVPLGKHKIVIGTGSEYYLSKEPQTLEVDMTAAGKTITKQVEPPKYNAMYWALNIGGGLVGAVLILLTLPK